MDAAKISNGIVENIIVADSLDAFGPDVLLVQAVDALGNVAQIGHTWDGAKFAAPAPTPEQQAAAYAATVKMYDGFVQRLLDTTAQAFGYGDPNRPEVSPILHAISYAEEPAVREFQAEGRLMRAWRSKVWAAAANILGQFNRGERAAPSEAELLAEIETAAPKPTADDVDAEIARLSVGSGV